MALKSYDFSTPCNVFEPARERPVTEYGRDHILREIPQRIRCFLYKGERSPSGPAGRPTRRERNRAHGAATTSAWFMHATFIHATSSDYLHSNKQFHRSAESGWCRISEGRPDATQN